jgi:hypothetical protein
MPVLKRQRQDERIHLHSVFAKGIHSLPARYLDVVVTGTLAGDAAWCVITRSRIRMSLFNWETRGSLLHA